MSFNFDDPFDPMSPFFLDEFIFNEEKNRDDDYCYSSCPDCGEQLKYRYDAEKVRCPNCGGRFRIN